MEDENPKPPLTNAWSQNCAVVGLSTEEAGVVESVYCGLRDRVSTLNIYRKLMKWVRKINGVGAQEESKGSREGETERRKTKGEGVWRKEKQGRDEEGGREEWRREQGRRGNESKGRGYGQPAVLHTAYPPSARTNLKTKKDSPPPHTHPCSTNRATSPPSVSPTFLLTPEKGCGSAPSASTDQDDTIDEQREVAGALEVQLRRLCELGVYDCCGEALRGG
jgi:hypothetical protein